MKSAGLTTSLDTNDDPDDRWEGALDATLPYVDILLPNEREAMKIARANDLETAVGRLSERVKTVVVKLGSRGAMAIRAGQRFAAHAVNVQIVDPVGAGDSFDAGFLHQFLRGADLEACLVYGNLCGAFSTTASGGTEAFWDLKAMKEFFGKHGAS
jgi:sugar/nucleoside kinase (ribokinase family)